VITKSRTSLVEQSGSEDGREKSPKNSKKMMDSGRRRNWLKLSAGVLH
jgi:hypothetical protein